MLHRDALDQLAPRLQEGGPMSAAQVAGSDRGRIYSRVLTLDGLTLDTRVPETPSAPPILMIHGVMGGAWYFEKYLGFFSERGHPSYAVNLRGHHGSRPVPDAGRVSVLDYVADARDALRGIMARHARALPVVLGHSMGGLVAQKLAESETPRALILVSPVPPRGIPMFSLPLLRRQLRNIPGMIASRALVASPEETADLFLNRLSVERRSALEPKWLPVSGRAGLEMSLGRVAVNPNLVRARVLVVTGAEDRAIAPGVQSRIARKYDARHLVYPGHAHFLIDEPGWERPASDIAAWLQSPALQEEAY